MSRILLVDDSPHAQRMGERILSEEGYEVVAVSNADSALMVDNVPALFQTASQIRRRLAIILHDQYPHPLRPLSAQ